MALKPLFQTLFQNFAVLWGDTELVVKSLCQNAVVLMLWKLLLLEGS